MSRSYLRRISKAQVNPHVLEAISAAIETHIKSGGSVSGEAGMFIALGVLRSHRIDGNSVPATLFRMQALQNLVVSGALAEWQRFGRADDGGILVDVSVFAAAAKARLILSNERGEDPRFDIEQFKQLALASATAEGRA